jgi:serine protease Do
MQLLAQVDVVIERRRGRWRTVPSTQCLVRTTRYALPIFAAIAFATAARCQESTTVLARGTLLAPKAFRSAAARLAPSLVRIEGLGGIAAGGGEYQAPGEGPTTGLVISEGGYIVTSTFNFLRKPPIITVVTPDGRRHIAELLGRDETRKICLLKAEGMSDLPVPEVAARNDLRVGQWAIAVGVGFGAGEPAISAGIVSATSRISAKAVQTDANTSPANYGGPLVDLDGRVIGICVPLSPGSKDEAAGAEWYDSGTGFAVPLDGLEPILDRLKAGETLRHPFLGIRAEPYGDPATGAAIKEVVADSPAAKAGLSAGDKIVSIGDLPVLDVAHLGTVINRHLAGDQIKIVVLRGEETMALTAELAVPPPSAVSTPMPDVPDMPGDPPRPPAPRRPEPPAM